MILLTMPSHHGNIYAMEQLVNRGFSGQVTAIVEYADEIQVLKALGAHQVFHVYDEAGAELADSAFRLREQG